MTTSQPAVAAIRKAGPADAAEVSLALAQAFHADPLFSWLVPDDSIRAEANRRAFELFIEEIAPHDDVWTTQDGITGAALWVPSGQPPVAEERAEGFITQMLSITGADPDRLGATFALLDEHHPTEPHEYLWFVGVVPQAQGRGIGSSLISPVLQRADRTGVPAYLEATSPRNRALYEQHGFRASAPISVAGGPPLWPMWRKPM
jgi:GNAT superfamily N-acetyltransferase